MRCPYCTASDTRVVDTRESAEFDVTRRRRECLKCKKRFTTYERVEMLDLVVVKKDGRREPFNRNKLRVGILKACEKRPVSLEKIDKMIDEIEAELKSLETTEIQSKITGELIMDQLKNVDKVAYLRFASVYRDFNDIKSFEKEVNKLKKEGVKNGR